MRGATNRIKHNNCIEPQAEFVNHPTNSTLYLAIERQFFLATHARLENRECMYTRFISPPKIRISRHAANPPMPFPKSVTLKIQSQNKPIVSRACSCPPKYRIIPYIMNERISRVTRCRSEGERAESDKSRKKVLNDDGVHASTAGGHTRSRSRPTRNCPRFVRSVLNAKGMHRKYMAKGPPPSGRGMEMGRAEHRRGLQAL